MNNNTKYKIGMSKMIMIKLINIVNKKRISKYEKLWRV